ncbi:hypothetical protein P3342_009492 [Pyrenophora teres f. teres]|nr:hypothetical protein P3342_009492 [Pyrenophora teres f. teres]
MEIREQERHALQPYAHIRPPYHEEVGRGTYPALATSRAVGQSYSRHTTMKAWENCLPRIMIGGALFQQRPAVCSGIALADRQLFPKLLQLNTPPHLFESSDPFLNQPLTVSMLTGTPTTSIASRTHSSRQLLKPLLSHRSACRICDKTTATSYNPIIACPGCSRLYHDSCRKPALSPGAMPERWRCSSCLANDRTHKSSELSSAATFKHSVVRDIFKPRSVHVLPAAIPSHTYHTYHHATPNSRPEAPGLHTPSIHLMGSLNRPGEAHRLPQQHEPRLTEMPTHMSGLLALRAPSSKTNHDVEAPDRIPLDARYQPQELTPSKALCSKMHVPTEPIIGSTENQSCRDRLSIIEQNTRDSRWYSSLRHSNRN